MWEEIFEYFVLEQESEYIIRFRLKEKFGKVINQNFRYLLIDQEDKFVVYSSISQKDHTRVVNKHTFSAKDEAEVYIKAEMEEIINENILYFIFGKKG